MVLVYCIPTSEVLVRELNMSLIDIIAVDIDTVHTSSSETDEVLMAGSRIFKELLPPVGVKRKRRRYLTCRISIFHTSQINDAASSRWC